MRIWWVRPVVSEAPTRDTGPSGVSAKCSRTVTSVPAGDSLRLVVEDLGVSGGSVAVRLSSSEGDEEEVRLLAQGGGRFGLLPPSAVGAAQAGDGVLQVGGGGLVEAVYLDTVEGLPVRRTAQVRVLGGGGEEFAGRV